MNLKIQPAEKMDLVQLDNNFYYFHNIFTNIENINNETICQTSDCVSILTLNVELIVKGLNLNESILKQCALFTFPKIQKALVIKKTKLIM